MAELFEYNLSPVQEELVSDIMIGLMRQVESDLKMALADRLSLLEHVPLRLVLHLAQDEMVVAGPVLRRSPVFSDLDLIYIIKSRGPDYWQAIASRKSLSVPLMDTLADTRDPGTAQVLAENEYVRLSEHAFEVLCDMAQHSEVLARPLAARQELPDEVAKRLYEFVGEEIKSYITSRFGNISQAASDAIDDVVAEFATQGDNNFMPTEKMIQAAEAFAAQGRLTTNLMLDTLVRGQIPSFIAQFARYTAMPVKSVIEVLRQPCGQGLAIAARAFGMQKSEFIKIYLLTQKLRSSGSLVNERELSKAMAYYDRLTVEVAQRLMRGAATV